MRKRFVASALSLMLLLCLLPLSALGEVVKLPIDTSGGLPMQQEYERGMTVYEDPSIRVEWYRVDNKDTRFNCMYYVAKISIADASQLRTASVNGFDHNNRAKAHVMARRTNAVMAINGDFYGARPET